MKIREKIYLIKAIAVDLALTLAISFIVALLLYISMINEILL